MWVSAPSAGGLVRVDLSTGVVSTIALEEAPGPLTSAGEALWVVADANWADYGDDVAVDESVDDFDWDRPRPAWRVTGSSPARVELGGDVYRAVALDDGALLLVLRRPDDPVVETLGRHSIGYSYPGVLARSEVSGETVVLTELADMRGSVFVDGGRYWLAGVDLPGHPSPGSGVSSFDLPLAPLYEVDVATGGVISAVVAPVPDTVVDDVAVTLDRHYRSMFGSRAARCEAVCFDLARDGESWRVPLPTDVDTYDGIVVCGRQVWFLGAEGNQLVWLDPRTRATGAIAQTIDVALSAPEAVPPPGLDLDAFEQREFNRLRTALVDDPRDASGRLGAFIDGIEIESVELLGAFPESHVVVRFRAHDRPGIRFARRWNLYDELGNAADLELADMHLSEDIESSRLPTLEECQPGADGIVWI